jgi:hypothetical protein
MDGEKTKPFIVYAIVNGGGKLGHMPAAEWGSSARRFLTVWHG